MWKCAGGSGRRCLVCHRPTRLRCQAPRRRFGSGNKPDSLWLFLDTVWTHYSVTENILFRLGCFTWVSHRTVSTKERVSVSLKYYCWPSKASPVLTSRVRLSVCLSVGYMTQLWPTASTGFFSQPLLKDFLQKNFRILIVERFATLWAPSSVVWARLTKFSGMFVSASNISTDFYSISLSRKGRLYQSKPALG